MTPPSSPKNPNSETHNDIGNRNGSNNVKNHGNGNIGISNGRDIVNSPINITSVQNSKQVLELKVEELAQEEKTNKQIIKHHRSKRYKKGALLALISLLLLLSMIAVAYYWLFQQGHISLSDVINTITSTALPPLLTAIITLFGTLITGRASVNQFKEKTSAECTAEKRLQAVQTRWEEIEGLGILTSKEIAKIRRQK